MADTQSMSDADTTHAPTDPHEDGRGHAPTGEPLGEIDVEAWAYALGGAVLGGLVVVALFVAAGG